LGTIDWSDTGVGAIALADNTLKMLAQKNLISEIERGQIIDRAIADLEGAGKAEFAKAALSLRALFNRT